MRSRLAMPLALLAIGVLAAAAVVVDRGLSTDPEVDATLDAEAPEVPGVVPFSVYAPEGFEVELGGWGGGDGEPVESMSLSHYVDETRTIDVESDTEGLDDDFATEAVELVTDFEEEPDDVTAATRPFLVDGVNRPLAFAAIGDRWAAAGRVGDVAVKVTARGFKPEEVRLRALKDPGGFERGVPAYRPLRPDLQVLDPRRVTELTEGTSLEPHGARLARQARPALALLDSDEPQPSWIGGEPHLPVDARWPRGAHGPMAFIAQLSLAELDPKVWTGPRTGQLHVFCAVDPESFNVEGKGACAVLHTTGTELERRPFPSELHPDTRFGQQMVTPSAGLTVPDAFSIDFEDWEALWTLHEQLAAEQGWNTMSGRLLGWPTWQHDDNLGYLAEEGGGRAEDWSVLLQTDALDGELYVALPTADLEAGRFDNVQGMIEFD